MKKTQYIIILLMLFIGAWLVLEYGWVIDDYGLHCTRCLLKRYVVEKRLLGFTISKRDKVQAQPQDYERLFGHPCQHVFRTGGFGRTTRHLLGSGIACGITGEGAIFQYRIMAARAAFEAERRLGDSALALRTFSLIDELLPADFSVADRNQLNPYFANILYLLAEKLAQAKSPGDWRQVLDEAQTGFTNELENAIKARKLQNEPRGRGSF